MIDFLHIFLTNKKKPSHTLLKNNSHNWLQQHKWNWIQKKRYLDIWPLLFGWLLLLWIYFDCKKKRMFTTIFLSLYLWCKRRLVLWLGLFWTLSIIFIRARPNQNSKRLTIGVIHGHGLDSRHFYNVCGLFCCNRGGKNYPYLWTRPLLTLFG